jgi:hypothetical protein
MWARAGVGRFRAETARPCRRAALTADRTTHGTNYRQEGFRSHSSEEDAIEDINAEKSKFLSFKGAIPMGKIPIALELYSVREDAQEDLPGVLEQVAEMGYQGVEFAGFYGWEAEEIRKMLDDNGLVCCGSHQPIDSLLGDELLKSAEFNATLGNPFLKLLISHITFSSSAMILLILLYA